MSDPSPPAGKKSGQTPETRAWVARREMADRAIEAAHARAAEDAALIDAQRKRNVQAGPVPLIAGIILLSCVLLVALWLFLDRLTCDPMWSDKGLSSYCKPPPR